MDGTRGGFNEHAKGTWKMRVELSKPATFVFLECFEWFGLLWELWVLGRGW